MKKIQYVALDVDDKSFHGCIVKSDHDGEVDFKSRPTAGALMKVLESKKAEGYEMKICYEATYLGYALQRQLTRRGYHCDVIAPSLTPRKTGVRVKTDRVDARKLAHYYKQGLLTPIYIPDLEQEKVRQMIRSREFLTRQLKALKVHILSDARRMELNYREAVDKPEANYWTALHRRWLDQTIKTMTGPEKLSFQLMINQLERMEADLNLYGEEIKCTADAPPYRDTVQALICYRGIDVLSAMVLVTELGDIRRFDHPSRLTSYAGMDITEYSSGGKERRYGISKQGNRHIRRTIIESSQYALEPPKISRPLKIRREGASAEQIKIADRCMKRLYQKSRQMWFRRKPHNKIKVACAREMLSFIWESLQLVYARS
jgi:transposase